MWDTILFDLDGTLTDSKPGITTAFAYSLRHFGIEADPDTLDRVIGPPLRDSFREFYHLDEADIPEAIRIYREYYADRGWAENAPYPGIPELLAQLKSAGKRLFVATSKPERYSLRIIEHFGLAPYFDGVCGAPMDESSGNLKENVIAETLRRAGAGSTDGVVMVGDRHHDIYGAHLNCLPAIGVLYGYGGREELTAAGADYITQSVQSLGALLQGG